MKTKTYIQLKWVSIVVLSITLFNCERDPSEDTDFATFPSIGDIYTDAPVGLGTNFYFPYNGSKATAWTVDNSEAYLGTSAMRFDVPNANDPDGNYAGAIFRIDGGYRNLTEFDALTFWAKASTGGAIINEIGFGEDFGENKFVTTRPDLQLTTNWVKYIVPIPDPLKLVQESGMLRYATGGIGEEGQEVGFTFWLDEVKFEKLGTIAQPRPAIYNGVDVTQNTFNGAIFTIDGLTQTTNLASGQDQTVIAAPAYYTFSSSNLNVATVNESGQVSVLNSGTAVITASLAGVSAKGSLTVNSSGDFQSAPTPTHEASNVISVFSDAYTNVPVDYFNGYWEGSTTQTEDIVLNNDNFKLYTQLNFVGIEFQNPTINADNMTHLHMDIYTSETINGNFTIKIRDRGANGLIESDFNGNPINDDKELAYNISTGGLNINGWTQIEIPLDGDLASQKNNLSQIVFVGGISSFTIDNIYFHN